MGKPRGLSRRSFLGGAAVAVSLPYFEAMVPGGRARAAIDDPRRLCFIHVPSGMIRTNLTPPRVAGSVQPTLAELAASGTLPSQLEPLRPILDSVSVLTGLSQKPAMSLYTYPDGRTDDLQAGHHGRDSGSWLTCQRIPKGEDESRIRNGVSVDQLAAQHLASQNATAIPSLALGTRAGGYEGDQGHARVFTASISWVDDRTAAPKHVHPRAVFDSLFGGVDIGASEAERTRRRLLRLSVLDSAIDDAGRLERQLGVRDRQRLDEYLTSVREIERRVESSGGQPFCAGATEPAARETMSFDQYVDVMFDLIALSFECDRTRVASLMLDKDDHIYDWTYPRPAYPPATEEHHYLSHMPSTGTALLVEAINRWQLSKLERLCTRLNNTIEGDGNTILENSAIVFGGGLDATTHESGDAFGDLSPQRNGPPHRHTNLPTFVAGGGGGMLRTGEHLIYDRQEPIADLYIGLLRTLGIEVPTFGLEGTVPLSGLLR